MKYSKYDSHRIKNYPKQTIVGLHMYSGMTVLESNLNRLSFREDAQVGGFSSEHPKLYKVSKLSSLFSLRRSQVRT